MPSLTQAQFAEIIAAAADARRKVKNVRQVGEYAVVADILSRSGKSVYQWFFKFNEATGDYEYSGAFIDANEPKFFGDAIRNAIRGITGS